MPAPALGWATTCTCFLVPAQEFGLFLLEPPAFSTLHHLQADVAATRAAWAHYAAFLADRQALADCEWLTVREQLWKLEDFAAKWAP